MSTPRLVRQLVPLIGMLFALAIFTSFLFRAHDVSIKELELSSRWLGAGRRAQLGGAEQEELGVDEEEDEWDDREDGALRDAALTGESGLLVEATEKDWATDELTDEDLSPENIDAILKQEWVYDEENEETTIPDRGDYRELFSLTTRDRKFFPIFAEGQKIYDPSILPHPSKHDTWIVVAQNQYPGDGQVVCQSGFLNGKLFCDKAERVPLKLQQSSIPGSCSDDLESYKDSKKSINARMFYSPQVPYISYGAPSQRNCYGQRLQDGRRLLQGFAIEQFAGQQTFKRPTELQKPGDYHAVEKDYFLFWDAEGKAYVHHDLYPERVFAELDIDGSVGPNLASIATTRDQLCMAKYLPRLDADAAERIQQATNSLSITLCKRRDPLCTPTEANTYIMHVFHLASAVDGHAVHEPYLLLFAQTPPFALVAVSQRPYWIHGRDVLSANSSSIQYVGRAAEIPEGHTERFSVTGLSWKTHGQKYHGFIDDTVLLGLGIEDSKAGGIDVSAGDLVEDLAFCSE